MDGEKGGQRKEYLLKMVESYYRSPRRWDDALEWRRLHFRYYPRIQADVYERIFARTDMAATCLTPHIWECQIVTKYSQALFLVSK